MGDYKVIGDGAFNAYTPFGHRNFDHPVQGEIHGLFEDYMADADAGLPWGMRTLMKAARNYNSPYTAAAVAGAAGIFRGTKDYLATKRQAGDANVAFASNKRQKTQEVATTSYKPVLYSQSLVPGRRKVYPQKCGRNCNPYGKRRSNAKAYHAFRYKKRRRKSTWYC